MYTRIDLGKAPLAGPFYVPVDDSRGSPDIDLGGLTDAAFEFIAGKFPHRAYVQISLNYDLCPDPEKFDPNVTNINNMIINVDATISHQGEGPCHCKRRL